MSSGRGIPWQLFTVDGPQLIQINLNNIFLNGNFTEVTAEL